MATVTATLGLTLPIGTEKVSRAIINGNMQLIDSYAAATNQAIDNLNTKYRTSATRNTTNTQAGSMWVTKYGHIVMVYTSFQTSTTAPGNGVLFTIPEGYRPADDGVASVTVFSANSDTIASIGINTSGEVSGSTNKNKLRANEWYAGTICYVVP